MSLVVVSVGSTSFDALVRCACSTEVLQQLAEGGVEELTLQVGRGQLPPQLNSTLHSVEGDDQSGAGVALTRPSLRVSWFRYLPSLQPLLSRAALALGHGGAGTVLECLSAGVPLICVPNQHLLHDHQGELATRMEEEGRLRICTPEGLQRAIAEHFRGDAKKVPPLAPVEPRMFAAFLEDVMGLR